MEFQGKPEFFKYHKTFESDGRHLTWYLDVSPKSNRVLSLHFDSNEEGAQLALMNEVCRQVKGKSLGFIPAMSDLSFTGFYPIALVTYRHFLQETTGSTIPFCDQKGEEEDDLICRCFGVYKQEILSLLADGSGREYTLDFLGSELRAGIGCGSCHHDLIGLLSTFGFDVRKSLAQQEAKKPKEWETLDSQALAARCHDLLTLISQNEEGIDHLSVFGVKPGHVLIQYKGSLANAEAEKIIRTEIDRELGLGLEFSLR